ncbi:hypothetical protein HPB51_027144 [Rhipicephalus microplus]|uniref:DDE-1 domain-containing protein n=1 Tax=Rhipicephalus microplus TaxID=6941 RepID=A0A9J6D1B2_RHIMP|nr:hypothetical protein HPB51_027144 [Rhipicephalus microplus]
MIEQKAKDIDFLLGRNDFQGGLGWLQWFKEWGDIVGKAVTGESRAADLDSVEKWLEENWRDIAARYRAQDILNAVETALFWQMLPNKTLTCRGDKTSGGKANKARVSVLLAANLDGSKKLRPLVIGKSMAPWCFRNALSLPVTYQANPKAWMTGELFSRRLSSWNDDLVGENCKIVGRCQEGDNPELLEHGGFRMPGDDTPNSDSTEDTAGVSAEVWNELAESPGDIDGSFFDEFVSVDDDVPIMGQLQDEDYIADVVPTTSQSDSNMEIDDGPLPTSSEAISAVAFVRRYCLNVEGCGLSCSDSLYNGEACVLSQEAKSLTQNKKSGTILFHSRARKDRQGVPGGRFVGLLDGPLLVGKK